MRATNRKMQIVSQDGLRVMDYTGAYCKVGTNGRYILLAQLPNGHGIPMGEYSERTVVKSILYEIAYHAGNGKTVYELPEDHRF